MTLAWLTVSTPFVYASQQAQKERARQMPAEEKAEDNGTLPNNLTEEKTERNATSLSEYLHEALSFELHFCFITQRYTAHQSPFHLSFIPELVSPPPKAA